MTGGDLLVRNIGELATCDPAVDSDAGVILDAAILVRDGHVAWCGAEAELPAHLAGAASAEVDAGGACMVPGFVDCHTHLVFGGERAGEFDARHRGSTYEEIAAGGGGIRATVAATAAAGDDELLEVAAARARRATGAGTTTIEVKSGYGLLPAAELRLLDLTRDLAARVDADVVATLLALHSTPAGMTQADYVDLVLAELLPEAAGRAVFCDVFCDAAAFGVADCERVLAAARDLGLRPKLHAEQLSASGGAALAARVGAASAAHHEHQSPGAARAQAAARVGGVVLPGAALSLGGPYPDGRALIDLGMTVALATDCNPGTSNTIDMRLMIALAVGLLGLTPAEALVAATRGAAAALALTDRGVLATGRRFDAVLLDAATHVDISYALGGVAVKTTWVRGAEVVA
ncbi:MAG: imidazolonepropionase [Chloroflexota bacterium]|nr:imidazolonepropionase [Chloroflexota bacterium]